MAIILSVIGRLAIGLAGVNDVPSNETDFLPTNGGKPDKITICCKGNLLSVIGWLVCLGLGLPSRKDVGLSE